MEVCFMCRFPSYNEIFRQIDAKLKRHEETHYWLRTGNPFKVLDYKALAGDQHPTPLHKPCCLGNLSTLYSSLPLSSNSICIAFSSIRFFVPAPNHNVMYSLIYLISICTSLSIRYCPSILRWGLLPRRLCTRGQSNPPIIANCFMLPRVCILPL